VYLFAWSRFLNFYFFTEKVLGLPDRHWPSIQLQNDPSLAVQHLNLVTAFSESISSFVKCHNVGFLNNIRLLELAFGFIDAPRNMVRNASNQTVLSATRRERATRGCGTAPSL